MRALTLFIAPLLLALLAGTAQAQEKPAKDEPAKDEPTKGEPARKEREPRVPPALEKYKGRAIAQTMHFAGAPWLTRDSRQREEDCQQMLKCLQVKPGQTICDLGCGNGFYTLQLAQMVGPEGKVYGVDIQPEMLQLLRARAKDSDLKNVELALGTVIDPKVPDNTMDLVLLVDVYHEFSHPEHMLAAIRKSLKKTGRLVLVEFRAEDPNVPIKPEHKMTKAQVLKELEPNGFKLVEQYDKLPWQHVMFFEKTEGDAKGAKDEKGEK
jgi:ubiquinone/menaquinone biosynthesis C-methylase UbiE